MKRLPVFRFGLYRTDEIVKHEKKFGNCIGCEYRYRKQSCRRKNEIAYGMIFRLETEFRYDSVFFGNIEFGGRKIDFFRDGSTEEFLVPESAEFSCIDGLVRVAANKNGTAENGIVLQIVTNKKIIVEFKFC